MPRGKLLGVKILIRDERGESHLVWDEEVFKEGFPGGVSFDQRIEGFP